VVKDIAKKRDIRKFDRLYHNYSKKGYKVVNIGRNLEVYKRAVRADPIRSEKGSNKLDTHVINASTALGLPIRGGRRGTIAIIIKIEIAMVYRYYTLSVLIDLSAEENFIS